MNQFTTRTSLLLLSVFITLLSTGCEKCNDIQEKPDLPKTPDTGQCDEVVTFQDLGMCGGMWFSTDDGVFLEVFGLDRKTFSLEQGDRIAMSYSDFEKEGITCLAISEFEASMDEMDIQRSRTVRVSCFDSKKIDLPHFDTKEGLIYRDPGICSGLWFEDRDGIIYEVFQYPTDGSDLKVGEKVSFRFEEFDASNLIECEAISMFEVKMNEEGRTIKTVKYRGR